MRGPYRDNNYAVTFDGGTPDRPHFIPLMSQDYDVAKTEALKYAHDQGIDETAIRIFYRVQVTAYTDWAEVGDTTDYQEVIDELYRDFRP